MDNELELQFDYIEKVRSILNKRYNGITLYAHLHSYGCQQNVNDGERMKGMLALMGYSFCDNPSDADLVIYNTCAVREHAELKVFGNVGALMHHKERNKRMVIGLCGCMMQQEHIAAKIKKSYPYVDLVFGTHVQHKLPQMLYNHLVKDERVFDTEQCVGIIEGIPIRRDGEFKAFIPIMYGCNNFCTYCIVPYVRGRERSRHSSDIINEFKGLIKDGYKEITLLGQNVNSYGKGIDGELNFSELLRVLNDIDGDFRIRFMTSHPKDATYELIDTIVACDKVCSHFHLPIQSGCDKTLKAMNRGYTSDDYVKLINYARSKQPDICFTTDIIVGFPQESYEEFRETLQLVKKIRFSSIFSFIYSKRNGTKAALIEDNISKQEKLKWFNELLELQRSIGKEKYNECIGKTVRVLVEGIGKTGDKYLTGRSDGYIIVDFIGDTSLIGNFVDIKITQALNWALLGEIK